MYFSIDTALTNNYTDNNTIFAWALSVPDLVSKNDIDWFNLNKMIKTREKIQAILLNGRKSDLSNLQLNIDYEAIKSVLSTKILGITLHNQFHFNPHIGNICRSAANQLNALWDFNFFLNFKAKHVSIKL